VSQKTKQDYESFRVVIDKKPTGLIIKSDNKSDAKRQLVIAAKRLGFPRDEVSLV